MPDRMELECVVYSWFFGLKAAVSVCSVRLGEAVHGATVFTLGLRWAQVLVADRRSGTRGGKHGIQRAR